MRLESLLGRTLWNLPSEFIQLLERNFVKLSRETEPYAVNVSYTLRDSDLVNSLQVDATASAITVYLPEQPMGNRRRTVTKVDASGNAVTVDGNGSLINGQPFIVLAAQYNSLTVEPTGTGWLLVAMVP